MTSGHYDVVIIGGGIMGMASAFYLSKDGRFSGKILVVEQDPTYARASTMLSAASIRTQFSNPLNIEVSKFGLEVIRDFASALELEGERLDLGFQECGYLYLASTDAQAGTLRENHKVQSASGADIVLLDQEELEQAFPHLNTHDLKLAAYGKSGEGWFDSASFHQGFRKGALGQGVEFLNDMVTGLELKSGLVHRVNLSSGGSLKPGIVVNAAGPFAAHVADMARAPLPVERRKRTVFVFDCANSPQGSANLNSGRLPLICDPSGVWCRPEGNHFLAASVPNPDCAVEPDDFAPEYTQFEDSVWPALAHRSTNFEAVKVINQWAGHYAYNTLDQNMILGPHPEIANFIFANGFSGHGLQQAPAVGRAVSEIISFGRFDTIDLSAFGYERVMSNTPIYERCII